MSYVEPLENIRFFWLPILLQLIFCADVLFSLIFGEPQEPFRYRAVNVFSNTVIFFSRAVAILIFKVFLKANYTFLQDHSLPAISLASKPLELVICFLAADFLYYVWHRLSHSYRYLWFAHQIHHQDTKFNLSTGNRVGVLEFLTFLPFGLLGRVLGLPGKVYFSCVEINLLLMYLLHTRLPRLPKIFETFFNTPANHRLHHQMGKMSGQCNYGGVFSFWDVLFGTYRLGEEPTQFGVVQAVATVAPISNQLNGLLNIRNFKTEQSNWGEFSLVELFSILFISASAYLATELALYKIESAILFFVFLIATEMSRYRGSYRVAFWFLSLGVAIWFTKLNIHEMLQKQYSWFYLVILLPFIFIPLILTAKEKYFSGPQ